jgi:predicted NAD/FAD-dependent oxidoreductase
MTSASPRVLIVGAGMAGLTAARALHDAGIVVHVVDKGRSPGGRLSTRRIMNGEALTAAEAEWSFDHGAQYFTVRDRAFQPVVDEWQAAGIIAPWRGRLASFDSEGREAVDDSVARWVGVPGMNRVGRHLAAGLDVACSVTVTGLRVDAATHQWTARLRSLASPETPESESSGWDAVIVTAPPPQALQLLPDDVHVRSALSAVRMEPCWAVLAAFGERVPAPFDGAYVSSSPLAWIARNSSKPGRTGGETWVLHASPEWSAAHVEDHADAVGPFLLNAFGDLLRAPMPLPSHVSAHRWRYARAAEPLHVRTLTDEAHRVAVAGDWCAGNRVEGAWLSGQAAAASIRALL